MWLALLFPRERGSQIKCFSTPEKSKVFSHTVENQNEPSHLPEKNPLTEKNEVSGTSSKKEFSGGSEDFCEVTVGGKDTPCELPEISEGQSTVSARFRKEQKSPESQKGLSETKKSPEGQKKSEFGDLRSSPTQFSKRQKIESSPDVLALRNSELAECFGEKLGNFPPASHIPQGLTDSQNQQGLRGMGSPIREAPSLGTGGGRPVSENPPSPDFIQKTIMDSMETVTKFHSGNFVENASGFQRKTTHSGGLRTPKTKLGTDSSDGSLPMGGSLINSLSAMQISRTPSQTCPQPSFSDNISPSTAPVLSQNILGKHTVQIFGEAFDSALLRTPPACWNFGVSPSGE